MQIKNAASVGFGVETYNKSPLHAELREAFHCSQSQIYGFCLQGLSSVPERTFQRQQRLYPSLYPNQAPF